MRYGKPMRNDEGEQATHLARTSLASVRREVKGGEIKKKALICEYSLHETMFWGDKTG
jgi:hypothetical protein